MRGQAWVVFGSVEAATKALNRLNDYVFFDKPIKAKFANENSDVIAKLEGKFVPREKKPETTSSGESTAKRAKLSNDTSSGPASGATTTGGGGHDSNNPPGPILKVDNIPEDTSKESLIEIFSKYEGYLDLRHVPSKQLAFVEYKTTEYAKVVREGLRGYQISPSHKLRVNYAKPRDT